MFVTSHVTLNILIPALQRQLFSPFNFPEKSTKERGCSECCNSRAWYWVHMFDFWSIRRNREEGRGGFMPSYCVFLPSRCSYPPSHFSRIWRDTRRVASRNRLRAQPCYKYPLDYHMWHSITRDTNAMSVPLSVASVLPFTYPILDIGVLFLILKGLEV